MDATLAQILNELYRITRERDELVRASGAFRKRILELEKDLRASRIDLPPSQVEQPETD